MGDTQPGASRGKPHLDDQRHPRAKVRFTFPAGASLPVHDGLAGIAFGDGGMRGAFHAGVIHALVTSGYFPRMVAGTSIGSLAGAVLCAAADRTGPEDGDARRALVDDWLATWVEGEPGRALWRELLGPEKPLRVAVEQLVDVPRDLGELGRAVDEVRAALVDLGESRRTLVAYATLLRWGAAVVARLPLRTNARLAGALARHVVREARRAGFTAVVRGPFGALFPDGAWDGLQVALDGFRMRASLCPASLDQSPFARFFDAHQLGRASRTMGGFARSRLLLDVANVSALDAPGGAPRLLRLGASKELADGTLLWPALRAACAMVPVFEAQRAKDVFADRRTLDGVKCAPDDQLVDASVVQYAPLSAVLAAWKEEARDVDPWEAPDRRLFAVYLGPADETETQRAPGSAPPVFVGSGLRSLGLKWQEDLQFNARVISLVTQQVRAIRRAAEPDGESPGLLHDASGLPYLPVDVSTIAPGDLLTEEMISAPSGEAHAKSIAAGCRATLQVLHASTIEALGGDEGVACDALLDHLAEGNDARTRGYLRPLPRACANCSRKLRAPPEATPHIDEPADFKPLEQGNNAAPLDVVVPAGGVFRGVFQVGAVAGLRAYGVRPKLYAGASVGTLFSLLLEASIRNKDDVTPLVGAVRLMQTLPSWVDAERGAPGRFEVLQWRAAARLAEHPGFLAMRPREVLDALTGDGPRWPEVAAALALDPGSREALAAALGALVEGRLSEAVPALDRVLAAWKVAAPGGPYRIPEVIGLDHVGTELRRLMRLGEKADPDLNEYGEKAQARFLFTATDHDRGALLHFGIAPLALGRDGVKRWPRAVPAALAASSFPMAFRLRTGEEVDGAEPTGATPWRLFADGGILNNFPSDSALAYLRRLSAHEGYGWLATQQHRVFLLSLTEPPDVPRGDRHGDGLVGVLRRWAVAAEQEKIYRTIVTQRNVNRIARQAGPILAAERDLVRRSPSARKAVAPDDLLPAIRVRFVHIAPARASYPHPFAYKPELGFRVETQNELVAAGCRRTRIAIELERAREAALPVGEVTPEDFERRVRAALDASLARTPPRDGCLLGELTPEGGRDCPFRANNLPEVFEACRRTARLDAPLVDLVGDFDREPPEAPIASAVTAAVDAIRSAASIDDV
ncbi:MAG: patatin-like phospholipase family protein [Polyangiales bacterium]